MAKKKAAKKKATAAKKVTRKKSAKTPTKKKTVKKKLAKKSAVKKQVKKKSGVKKKATVKKKSTNKAAASPKKATKRKSTKANRGFRRFELVDGKSSKFWEISQNGSEFTVRYGRIGTDGQSKTKAMGSSEKTAAEVEKLIRAKATKGYMEFSGDKKAAATGRKSSAAKSSRKKLAKKSAVKKVKKNSSKNVKRTPAGKPTKATKRKAPAKQTGSNSVSRGGDLTADQQKQIHKLLKSNEVKNIQRAIELLESTNASAENWSQSFSSPIINTLINNWDLKLLLVIGDGLSGHAELRAQFFSALAKRICKNGITEAYGMFERFFNASNPKLAGAPTTSGEYPYGAYWSLKAGPALPIDLRAETGSEFTQGYGTIIFEAFYRDLMLDGCIRLENHFDARCSSSVFKTFENQEFSPSFDMEDYCHNFGDSSGPSLVPYTFEDAAEKNEFEFTFAYSESNFIPGSGDFEWFDEDGFDDIDFLKTLLSKKEAKYAPFVFLLWMASGADYIPEMFTWRPQGVQMLDQMGRGYMKSRKFISIDDTGGSGGSNIPGCRATDFPGDERFTFWEARLTSKEKSPISYSYLSGNMKALLHEFLLALRAEARITKTRTNVPVYANGRRKEIKWPVIESLVNHLLICMAMHKSTPQSVIDKLKRDNTAAVSKCAESSQKPANKNQPQQLMGAIIQKLVDKAGRSRGQGKPKVSEEAKQLALLAQRAAHDTDQLNQLGETDEYSHFNGLFGCTLAVGATKNWVKLNAVGEQLIKETLKKIQAKPSTDMED